MPDRDLSGLVEPPDRAERREYYAAFGLTVASELPLGSAVAAPADLAPKVRIAFGEVPERLGSFRSSGAGFQAAPGNLLLWLDAERRFLVSGGDTILVHPSATVPPKVLAELLLTSPLGGLLLQRQALALHAGLALLGRQAIVLAGPSGSGKSALTAIFRRRGFPILSDEISVVRPSEAGALAESGLPRITLPRPAFESLKCADDPLEFVRPGSPKVLLDARRGFEPGSHRLGAIFLLEQDNRRPPSIAPVEPAERLPALMGQIYRRELVEGLGVAAGLRATAAGIASATALYRATCPRGLDQLEALADLIAANSPASSP